MTKTINKKASYWRYDGNHMAGRDCERKDPHGFGIALISYVAYSGDGGATSLPMSMCNQIVVKHKRGDSFGHEIEVTAPSDVWESAKTYLEKDQESYAI